VNPKVLKATVERWNQLCRQGLDDDFHRPPKTMMTIATPRFYVMEAWPIVNNTPKEKSPARMPQRSKRGANYRIDN
jgi:hypothetical protein